MAESEASGSEDDQHVLQVHFLDGSWKEVDINDDTNFGEVHERLVQKLRATDKISPRDPLLHEFALFKHIGSPVEAHYILPEYLVFPVVESFEEVDKICFQRLIFPTPQLDAEVEVSSSYADRHKTPRTNSSAITPPATDTESSGASPRSQLSSSVQSLPGDSSGSASVAGFNPEYEPASPMTKSLTDSRSSTPGSTASPIRPHTDSSTEHNSERKSPRSRSRSLSSVPNLRSINSIVKLSPRNSPRQESPRIAPYKFHVPTDPILRWLEYCECLNIFQRQPLFKPMLKEVFEIGALDLLIKSKRENVSTKTLLKLRLNEFVPERFVTASKSNTAIEQLMNILADIKLLSADAAMQELIQVVSKWKYYGSCLFFDCKPSDKRVSTKPVILAINEDGLLLLKKDGDVMYIYPLNSVTSWSSGFTSFQLESAPDPHHPHLSYSDAPPSISLETSQGETIGRVLSAVVDRKVRMVFDLIKSESLDQSSPSTSPRRNLVNSVSK